MRIPPLGLPVELPMGSRSAVLCEENACEHRQWGLRWSPFGATKRCTVWGKRMRTQSLRPS
eukprot:3573630-Pyramimonas_sp.AAC.1